jgi:hypothetical protein
MDLRGGSLWFFTVGGVILVLSGVTQALVRPPRARESRIVNRGTIFGLVCVTMGVAAILLGQGVLTVGGR